MSLPTRAWMFSARARLRARAGGKRPPADWRDRLQEELVARLAPARAFLDAGGMWGAHGRVAFLAESAGAAAVTLLDAAPETGEYAAERERRGSSVRYLHGDINDPQLPARIGPHDVVWCSGVLYHAPNPMLTLERLAALTTDTLVLGSLTIPELPAIEQGCVFYPGLGERARAPYAAVSPPNAVGLTSDFDPDPQRTYANYWWGITPSALRAMTEAAGLRVVEQHAPSGFETHLVARKPE